MCLVVCGSPVVEGSVYNLADQKIAYRTSSNATMPNGTLPKGIYIVDGKKVVLR